MKVNKVKLEWKNKCCGCNNDITAGEDTYILSEITGIDGSVHFCGKCVKNIKAQYELDLDTYKI